MELIEVRNGSSTAAALGKEGISDEVFNTGDQNR